MSWGLGVCSVLVRSVSPCRLVLEVRLFPSPPCAVLSVGPSVCFFLPLAFRGLPGFGLPCACVCNIWTDVKLLLWQGGSARLTDTAQRRHCQLVVIWSLINSTYLQMIFFWPLSHGAKPRTPQFFFGFCMVSAICFVEPGDILYIYSMYSFHRHGRGLSREPWTLTWSLSPWRELVLQ